MKSSGKGQGARGKGNIFYSSLVSRLSSLANKGFTLIEILVAVAILAIVMSILYGTFSMSSANARVIEERADELSLLTGAVDILSQEVRGAFLASDEVSELFSGKKEKITFTAVTPFVKDDEPVIQRVSYLFDDGNMIRKVFKVGQEAEVKSESLILEGANDPSFSYFNGKEWLEEWPSGRNLPYGVKVAFSCKGKNVETVIPVWSRK